MANRINCYVCHVRYYPRNLVRIFAEEREDVREIAIERRGELGRAPLDVGPNTRICNNCYLSILREIRLQRDNPPRPFTLQLNVLRQGQNNSCLICQREVDVHRLTIECKADVFAKCNIFIPENVVCCNRHLDVNNNILQNLLPGLRCINRLIIINPQYLQRFLEALQSHAHGKRDLHNANELSEGEMQTLTSLSKENFEQLFAYCDRIPQRGGHRYVYRRDLFAFLCKMRQGISDEFLTILFKYTSRQAASMAISTVRRSLMSRFVPENLGLTAITRERFINDHVTPYANTLYNPYPERPQAIAYIDGTYTDCYKSKNFRALRQTFCLHKGRHLVKPAIITAPDGYLLDIHGPYFSDAQNNDAAMLTHEMANDPDFVQWFQRGDIFIFDRGYRDAVQLLQNLGFTSLMPPLLQPGQTQLTTADANMARLITLTRFIVEMRNGHLKSIYKLLAMAQEIHVIPNVGDYYRIAGALINRFRRVIVRPNATEELARQLLARSLERNILHARVVREGLMNANRHRWIRLDEGELQDFPVLTIDFLKTLTAGVYQIELAPSYIQDKLQRDDTDLFEVEALAHRNDVPQPGLLRVRIYSRHRRLVKYQLWIEYEPNANVQQRPIRGHYCTCIAGARTLGTCSHIASVLWYLGFARHQNNVRYPSHRIVNEVEDAADRPPQLNPN